MVQTQRSLNADMGSRDFLRKAAVTPLCEHYTVAGAVCSLSTNSEQVFEAARASLMCVEQLPGPVDFSMRFWVDDAEQTRAPWSSPYVRGLDHLVFAGFDERSSILVDLRSRRVIGRFSAAMAGDCAYWRSVVFPILLSILAGSIGLVELHASCIAWDQRGLVLIGPSRSGKSTLALALTEAGFRLLSDDRIFCSLKQGKLLAYGLPRPLKLRREAACWFQHLRDQAPMGLQGGERVFYCEPNQHLEQPPSRTCEPQALVVLDQNPNPGFRMARMRRSDVKSRIEADLLAEAPEDIERQDHIIDGLLDLPCWHLQYGGRPQLIAKQIAKALFDHDEVDDSKSRMLGRTI
jgi:hypothetical protein